MPSQYLQPADYLVYGLPVSTTAPQVTSASLIIDSYLRREEGLVYMPDYAGLPCYMAGLVADPTFNSSGSISPGMNVVVPITEAAMAFSDMIGDVVILDRETPSKTEACVVTAMTQSQITLASVAQNHNSGCTLEFGLVILEEKSLASERSIGRTSRPAKRLLSGMGRYGYGRRTDQQMGLYNAANLLADIQAFGGPPMWIPFDISQCSVSYTTREVWIPAGVLLAYFSEIRLRYVSGYAQKALPPIIKQATAQIIKNFTNEPQLQGMIESIGAGDTKIQRFAPSMLDKDILMMINAFRIDLLI